MVLRYNEGPRDCQNLFAITRFRFIEVLFHIFYYYWGKKISFVTPRTSLYRGSLNRGLTVLRFSPEENNAVIEVGYQGNLSPDRKMIKLLRLLTFDEFVSVTATFSLNPVVSRFPAKNAACSRAGTT